MERQLGRVYSDSQRMLNVGLALATDMRILLSHSEWSEHLALAIGE
jgi:hypothetical protein